MQKNKQSFDWQRAQVANDRYVIGSHVKNAISFYLNAYCESVDGLITVLKRVPLKANLYSAAIQRLLQTCWPFYVLCLATSVTARGNLAPHDIIHEAKYCDKYARSFTQICMENIRGLVQRCSGRYVIGLLILWSWERCLLRLCTQNIHIPNIHRYKGKAALLKAWSGRKGSRKLRFRDFLTTAQDGGKVVSLTHRPPLPHLVLISVRGWVDPRAMVRPEGLCHWKIPMTTPGIDPATCRFVA